MRSPKVRTIKTFRKGGSSSGGGGGGGGGGGLSNRDIANIKGLEKNGDALKKDNSVGGNMDRLTTLADAVVRGTLRKDINSKRLGIDYISQLAGASKSRNTKFNDAADKVVGAAYNQLSISQRNRLALKRGTALTEYDFQPGSQGARVKADLLARRNRIKSNMR